jgi:small subunit ribosomal protein S8e
MQKLFKGTFLSIRMARKATGGKHKREKKKKLTGRQNQARVVKLGESRTKIMKGRGGNEKLVSLQNNVVNLNTETGTKKTTIKNVIETPSNIFLARQNILVKGAIIDTELGRAKITNRPSQEGNVQAVLLK